MGEMMSKIQRRVMIGVLFRIRKMSRERKMVSVLMDFNVSCHDYM